MKRFLLFLALLAGACSLGACGVAADYNSHVASRSATLSGFSKDGNAGGSVGYRVEYR